ncbi:MAG: type II secretion system protein [Patescibacteria group bacterium]
MKETKKFIKIKKSQEGFTLIELLVVISIIGFLASFAIFALNNARMKARDAQRIASLSQIQKAIDLYYNDNLIWPARTADGCCDGWDVGYCNSDKSDGFIQPLVTAGIMKEVPGDLKDYGACLGFAYYVYNEGSYSCPVSSGKFYILGIRDLETDSRPPTKFSGSGFSCTGRNWQNEFDYVVGKFENN